MKSVAKLTLFGKLRRLHTLALKALEDYNYFILDVHYLTMETNTTFMLNVARHIRQPERDHGAAPQNAASLNPPDETCDAHRHRQ
ncbi:MAG: hypothetical protein JXA97_10750 [Anaerolineales bacterium]|nr:hypothetical protein [Anaerolineales bacterium]